MSDFTHLHVHSHYSLLDGLPKIDQLLDFVKEEGMDSVALTDHGVLYGAVEFFKKAKKRNIKPIIGCEMYQAYERMGQKRPNIDDKRYHLVLLAKNEQGYKNLVKLITDAHLKGFYYKPRIDEELLKKHSQGLICLSACIQGKIPQLILSNKKKEARKTAKRYKEMFGNDFYLELQSHPNIKNYKKSNKGLIKLSKELNIPLVATNDVHYLKKEDSEAQDVLMLINTNADRNDPERLTMKSGDFSLRKEKEMKKRFSNFKEAIKNTQEIKEKCNFEFKLGKTKLPNYQVPNGKDPDSYLKELCLKGIKKRYPQKTKQVKERLNYELSIIKETGFASYFLIVQDFVNWAKENRIVVGPGRGSAGGSLVSYLLNITDIDPLKYNLLFERFLNPGRAKVSYPDIDLDFTDRRRDEVIEYVANKYGKDKVAQIITFGTMAARAVIRDVGRALNYSYGYCDQVAKMIPFGFNLEEALNQVQELEDFYQQDEKAKKLIDLGKKLEGVARHASTHACGVVISDKPLEKITPLQHPTQNDEAIVTQYEMHSIENLGLLKMDFLGLKNLTIIEDTLGRIYEVHGKNIDIEAIPLNDKKTFQLLRKAETQAIFQLDGQGMRRYLKQLKPTKFEDIIAMVALYRPGPMELIPEFIARKHGKKEVDYLHPKLKEILKSTYGLPVFQEQIMQIAQKLANYSLSEADVLRKAIGKKIKRLLDTQREKFIKGCIENDIPKEIAKKLFKWIEPHARYSFNKSHATAYATIAYRTAYLKAHYPVEFMSALLTSKKDDIDKIATLIEECRKMKIDVLPPDINESFRNFSVVPKQNKIRFGLLAIKNVGEAVVNAIVNERKQNGSFKSIESFLTRCCQNINKKSLESLIKAGAFDKFEERNKLLSNLKRLLEFSRETQKHKISGQRDLFQGEAKLSLKEAPLTEKSEKLKWEKELLGLYVSDNPLNKFKKLLRKKTIPINKIKEDLIAGRKVRVGGVISKIKKITTKNGNPMLFVNLKGLTDKIEVIVFSPVIKKNSTLFQENKIVMMKGRTDLRSGDPKIICKDIEEINQKSRSKK